MQCGELPQLRRDGACQMKTKNEVSGGKPNNPPGVFLKADDLIFCRCFEQGQYRRSWEPSPSWRSFACTGISLQVCERGTYRICSRPQETCVLPTRRRVRNFTSSKLAEHLLLLVGRLIGGIFYTFRIPLFFPFCCRTHS